MSTVEDRALGAIVGALVSDAAGLPLQWVYDADKLNKEILKDDQNPEFLSENHCPFFVLPTGKSSYYGEEIYTLLETLVSAKGWDRELYKKNLFAKFGPGTAYDHEKNGVDLNKKPINAPWLSSIMGAFIKAYQGNGDIYDKDPVIETAIQAVPLVVLYAGKPELKKYLEEMSEVTQNSQVATKICVTVGKILEREILSEGTEDAVKAVLEDGAEIAAIIDVMKEIMALEDKHTSCVDAVGQFGRHCEARACFKGGLYASMCGEGDYVKAVRASIRSGGDVCGRGAWLGALMGARVGLKGLPKDWIDKTQVAGPATTLAQQLLALRS